MNFEFNSMRFGGIRIVENPNLPKVPVMQVPAASLLSPAARARLNAGLLRQHGFHVKAVIICGTMYVHPEVGGELKAALGRVMDGVTLAAAVKAMDKAFEVLPDPLKKVLKVADHAADN